MSGIHVIAPGFLTTVQDLGRYGHAHRGISASGAADALALRAGNLLVQAMGAGEVKGLEEARAVVRRSFEISSYKL